MRFTHNSPLGGTIERITRVDAIVLPYLKPVHSEMAHHILIIHADPQMETRYEGRALVAVYQYQFPGIFPN
ncbi:hypothetical protein [Hymenobacter cavernae]|uniref:Uncharacterized protein n=1 Tax=Hymenobacter cavernae TaxID=2044852 RepID=A0ABQ1UPY8_9BACT|nr:hypothetical protein [Hymenobacter cavernae]GGF22592.1 hypothetical protein GCM10011383_37760 [Hymenobacter cavernae]